MPWYIYPLLVLAGMASGFVNILAGNGSLITLPALLFAGLPPQLANGTNRVGIVMQNVVGVSSFYRSKRLDVRGSVLLSLPAIIGSLLGAQIAVEIDPVLFKQVLAVVMVLMLAVMFVDPQKWLQEQCEEQDCRLRPIRFVIFFLIGLYGGFLQAGIGIFLLAALVLDAGYDVVRGNAVKIAIVLSITLVALLVFSANAQVEWMTGILMGLGSMIGAYLATRLAVDKGAVWVRRVVIVVVVVSVVQLLGGFDLVSRLL